MQRHTVPYKATGRFAPIVTDYLADAPALRALHTHRPDRPGILKAAAERRFTDAQRATLVDALHRQYAGLEMGDAVRHNLELLARPGTCTVTTGHQLCLFTGPLYVPFKILNAVRIAHELSTPERPIVPVFWMATEDHDLAEVDHAWVNGQRVQWPATAGGAVGRMELKGIGPVLDALERAMAPAPLNDALRSALHTAYAEGRTLAEATRRLVHHLFGAFGILIIDGDDPELKRAFVPIAERELLEGITAQVVQHASDQLAPSYAVQVNPRPLNLFHLAEGRRARIEREGDGFRVLDGGPSFTRSEVLAALAERPQDFSPNVLLRPVYQCTVLPDVAYVGGGGEVAYWLQLRPLFEAFGVPMPAVVLRTSAGVLTAKQARHWSSLGIGWEYLFRPVEEVHARIATQHSGVDTVLAAEREQLARVHADLRARLIRVDPTLEKAALAQEHRALRGLERLESKLLRAAKRRSQDLTGRADAVRAAFMPSGLQERRDNILPWLNTRPALLSELLELLDPFDTQFSVLVEE